MARRPTEATEGRRWMKLSVSTRCSDCTASGKNRRRGGCSYGCARLCNFGKQIAAIKTRNMRYFGLTQRTCQKKVSKTIHKLEYKSRTRIRMRWLMGDLGRRSSWALGVGQSRPGRPSDTPHPSLMVYLLVEFYCLECNCPTCCEARVFVRPHMPNRPSSDIWRPFLQFHQRL